MVEYLPQHNNKRMKKLFTILVAAVLSVVAMAQDRTGLTEYKLPNGLTVILWEDHEQDDVEGYIAVRAGSVDEPQECTGLAHYLEHMLFKGTQRIGAIDWEKEKPYYEQIIALYDSLASTPDTDKASLARRDTLIARINRASLEAAKYSTTEDFFNLLDGMGATDVNAFTSYDMTCYHNRFAGNQMRKWLDIFSERLMNPVFRTFQAELENVYEEYNMYEDDISTQQQNKISAALYDGHAYARNVIGLPEHLKNPQLSKLINFYNTWYVANNMALIIVGDFDAQAAKPMIEQTFGRLPNRPLPARTQYPDAKFNGGKTYKYKLGYYPQIVWAFEGVKMNDEDLLPLSVVCQLLSNGQETGLLDKITLDGEVSWAGCGLDSRRDMGRIMVYAMPYYDVNQQTYESNKATENIVMREIDKIKNGQIEDWMINSIKKNLAQSNILAFEEGAAQMSSLRSCFIYDMPIDNIFTETAKIQALTKEDLQRVAKKYFDAPHVTIEFEKGDKKVNKINKPKIKPLDMPKGVETEYAKYFKSLPSGEIKQTYTDLSDVRIVNMGENVKLHYCPNTKNNIFNLTLRYGIGEKKMPMLPYVAAMMNVAGVFPDKDAQTFRRQLSELGAQVSYGCSDSYFTVNIYGDETNLDEICKLVQMQILMPKFDERQFESMKGGEMQSRFTIDKIDRNQASALKEYIMYGNQSAFLDIIPFMDVYRLDEGKLKEQYGVARTYALDIFYCGQKTTKEVSQAMNIFLTEGMQASTSPEFRTRQKYDKTQIFFLPNSNVQQATIYFYFEGVPYDTKMNALIGAFDQYFGGGFSGLVLDEIRTKRSMAYTASGYYSYGVRPGKNTCFMGYIGTQSDKVCDAVETFMNLVDSMPQFPERMENIKTMLLQEAQTEKPSFRTKASTQDYWREMGYTEDPNRQLVAALQNMTWEDLYAFYQQYIQGQPVSIIIMGDPKKIDQKRLQARFGKIQKVSKSKLFAPLEFDF